MPRDRYGKQPGRFMAIGGFFVTAILVGGIEYGLYHALTAWPLTLLWAVLLFFWTIGIIFGGIPLVIGDLVRAWKRPRHNFESD